jgi:hypothetical protein
MEPKGLLPFPHDPITVPYSEADESIPCPHILFLRVHFNIILPSSKYYFPLRIFDILCAFLIIPMPGTFPIHFIRHDLVTLIMFGEEYNLWSSSLCSTFHPWRVKHILRLDMLLFYDSFSNCAGHLFLDCPSFQGSVEKEMPLLSVSPFSLDVDSLLTWQCLR